MLRTARALILGAITLLTFPAVGAAQDRGGTVRGIIDAEPASLDPYFYRNFEDRSFYNLFYDTLVIQQPDGTIVPMLAESWQISGDGMTITMKLRDDVDFHDGTHFDANAVKFNIDRLLDEATGAPARGYVTDLAGVDVVDDYTVDFRLRQRSDVVLTALSIEPGLMASPAAIAKYGADFSRNPVGTGPFVFESWTSGEIRAKRNPAYWRDGADGKPLPYLDGVQIRIVPNASVRVLELLAGNAEIVNRISVQDFAQVEAKPDLVLVDHPQQALSYLTFNVTKPPFDNIDLRMAVSLAIDRNAVEKVIGAGKGVVATGIVPTSDWTYDPELAGQSLDIEAAKAAYQRSGHTGEIVLNVNQREPDTQVAQLIQAMLNSIGITTKIEVLERQAGLQPLLEKTYQVFLIRGTLPRPDPDMSFANFLTTNGANNYAGVSDDDIDEAIAKARGLSDRTERKRLYTDVQKLVMDRYYHSYLAWAPIRDAANRNLQGFAREFSGTWLYADMWLKQ